MEYTIALDIETLPAGPMPTPELMKPPAQMKKADTIAKWREEEAPKLVEEEYRKRSLDSMVGRSGVRLSGGQRQRLAIARMVLAEPKVVILDEATSALDAATEYALHQALNQFLNGRTTLIIAHRLSAVKQADRVLVFDGGSIAEDGGHQQLIAEGGLYAKLYGHLQH